jgi:hypothetical protein
MSILNKVNISTDSSHTSGTLHCLCFDGIKVFGVEFKKHQVSSKFYYLILRPNNLLIALFKEHEIQHPQPGNYLQSCNRFQYDSFRISAKLEYKESFKRLQ